MSSISNSLGDYNSDGYFTNCTCSGCMDVKGKIEKKKKLEASKKELLEQLEQATYKLDVKNIDTGSITVTTKTEKVKNDPTLWGCTANNKYKPGCTCSFCVGQNNLLKYTTLPSKLGTAYSTLTVDEAAVKIPWTTEKYVSYKPSWKWDLTFGGSSPNIQNLPNPVAPEPQWIVLETTDGFRKTIDADTISGSTTPSKEVNVFMYGFVVKFYKVPGDNYLYKEDPSSTYSPLNQPSFVKEQNGPTQPGKLAA